ncbi:hypothetical protein SprV_0902676500 [Sparganum proliferum]
MCPRCQRIFRSPIGLVGPLRTNCSTRTAPTVVSPSTSPSLPMSLTSTGRPPEPSLPPSSSSPSSFSSSSSSSSSSTASTSAAVASGAHIHITNNPDMPRNTTTTTTTIDTSGENLVYTCPRFDRTFTSHIGLVGHLRIRRTETGGSVPGAPTYTRRTRLHCPHCTRTFMYRMGLFGHMRAYEYLP